jgi:hypothetical protein
MRSMGVSEYLPPADYTGQLFKEMMCKENHIARVADRMSQFWSADILHLTKVNTYVASALQTKTPENPKQAVHLPRQTGSAALVGWNTTTGISGFAFQGTNAHVILAR